MTDPGATSPARGDAPAAPAEPAVPGAPGLAALAQARERLAATGGLSTADLVTAFDEVHRLLQDALAAVGQPG